MPTPISHDIMQGYVGGLVEITGKNDQYRVCGRIHSIDVGEERMRVSFEWLAVATRSDKRSTQWMEANEGTERLYEPFMEAYVAMDVGRGRIVLSSFPGQEIAQFTPAGQPLHKTDMTGLVEAMEAPGRAGKLRSYRGERG